MKTKKRFFFAQVLVILFCMTLTCAYAAVDEKLNQAVIGFLTMTKMEADNALAGDSERLEAADTSEASDEVAQFFNLPAMLQIMEADAFEGTAFARAADLESPSAPVMSVTVPLFRLPTMLQVVDDEAFAGIVAVVVELPEGVESIGERAFADNTSLRSIRIPEKTRYIGKNAFEGSHQVSISGATGSYARAWARENDIPFSPVTMVCAVVQNVSGQIHLSDAPVENIEESSGEGTELRPVWRTGEIKTESYKQQIAHQVQGRSPPSCA